MRDGGNLRSLFQGGFTTGGTGQGMRICAHVVRHAYGLTDYDQALNVGYVGARLLTDYFVAWVHWPIVRDAAPQQNGSGCISMP